MIARPDNGRTVEGREEDRRSATSVDDTLAIAVHTEAVSLEFRLGPCGELREMSRSTVKLCLQWSRNGEGCPRCLIG